MDGVECGKENLSTYCHQCLICDHSHITSSEYCSSPDHFTILIMAFTKLYHRTFALTSTFPHFVFNSYYNHTELYEGLPCFDLSSRECDHFHPLSD